MPDDRKLMRLLTLYTIDYNDRSVLTIKQSSCISLYAIVVSGSQISADSIKFVSERTLNDLRMIAEKTVVRNSLAFGIAVNEQCVVTECLYDIGPVKRVFVIVGITGFISDGSLAFLLQPLTIEGCMSARWHARCDVIRVARKH